MNGNNTIPEDFCGTSPSSNSTWDFFWTLTEPEYGIIAAVFFVLYLVVGLPWNCLVAGVILKKRLYQHPTIMLLLCLALCDSLMLVTVFPLNISTGLAGEFIFGNSDHMRCNICKMGLITTWFSYMSLTIVALMSVDRFIFIYKAMHYNRLVTPLKMTVVLLTVFFLCLLLSILPLFGFGSIGFYRLLVTCVVDFTLSSNYYLGLLVLAAVLPLLVLIVCNVWVASIVYKNVRSIYHNRKALLRQHPQEEHTSAIKKMMRKKRHQKQLHLMKVFGGLLSSNMLLWMPILAVAVTALFVPLDSIPPGIILVTNVTFMAQVVVHPAIESIILSDVRNPIKKILLSLCRCRRSSSQTGSGRTSSEVPDTHCWSKCSFLDIFQAALLPQEFKSSTNNETTEAEL